MNAKVLKVMRIGVLFAHRDQWWLTQRRRLQLYEKGSPGADVRFESLISFDKFGVGGVRAVMHDLSVSDPFAALF